MKFIAIVEDNRKSQIHEIAKSMEEMGVRVEQVLKFTGIIVGSIEGRQLSDFKIDGIKAIEEDRNVSTYR